MSAIIGYKDVKSEGMPILIVFMILPIVLHKSTRNSLPKQKNTPLISWIEENSSLCLGFPKRLISMKQFTRESLLYGLLNGIMFLDSNNNVSTDLSVGETNKVLRRLEGEARECILKSRFLGRWLGSSGSTRKIMFLWGIRP